MFSVAVSLVLNFKPFVVIFVSDKKFNWKIESEVTLTKNNVDVSNSQDVTGTFLQRFDTVGGPQLSQHRYCHYIYIILSLQMWIYFGYQAVIG